MNTLLSNGLIYIFAILITTLITTTTTVNSIDINVSVINDTVLLPIAIGNPRQWLLVIFDTASHDFWVKEYNDNQHQTTYETGFMHNQSETFIIKEMGNRMDIGHYQLMGSDAYDDLIIGHNASIAINQYPFLLVDQCNLRREIDGYFGFGYYNCNTKTIPSQGESLLSTLISQKVIEHQIFSLDICNELLQIGSFPNDIQIDLEHFSYCRVVQTYNNKTNQSWRCNLTGVYSSSNDTNFLKDNEQIPFEFNTGIKVVIVSYNLLHNLLMKFIPLPNHSKCSLLVTKVWFIIECNEYTDFNIMNDLKLSFGLMTLIIPKEELFIQRGRSFEFIFRTQANNDYWKIGTPLLRHFKFVFDVNRSVIGVYSNKGLVVNGYDMNKDEVFRAYKTIRSVSGMRSMVLIDMSLALVLVSGIIGIVLNMYLKYQLKYKSQFNYLSA